MPTPTPRDCEGKRGSLLFPGLLSLTRAAPVPGVVSLTTSAIGRLRGIAVALPFAAELVQEVVEDLLGQPPFLARQTEAHAPVRPLDDPVVPLSARFFPEAVRRLPDDLGVRHAVSFIPNYDGHSPAAGGART